MTDPPRLTGDPGFANDRDGSVLVEDHPELVRRFGVSAIPTIVVERLRECARIESPRGVKAIEQALAPWLS